MSLRPLIAACVTAAIILSACGAGKPAGDSSPAPPTDVRRPLPTTAKEFDARYSELGDIAKAAKARGDTRTLAAVEAETRRLERAEAEADAARFAPTKFEKAVDRLPLRRPPLYVEQVILTEGSHRVIVRPTARRFFCDRSPAERREAVAVYFREATFAVRAAGVTDLVLVVDALRETGDVRALAIADRRGVRLTRRGSGSGPC